MLIDKFTKQRLTHCSKLQANNDIPAKAPASSSMRYDSMFTKYIKLEEYKDRYTGAINNNYNKSPCGDSKSIGTLQNGKAHWATKYIGRPWMSCCQGPTAFDCWGLVKHVQKMVFNRHMPHLVIAAFPEVKTQDQWFKLRTLIAKTEWKRLIPPERPAESDIALMRSLRGPHVGVVIYADGKRGILHALGDVIHGGSVIFTPLENIVELGFQRIDYFRFTV